MTQQDGQPWTRQLPAMLIELSGHHVGHDNAAGEGESGDLISFTLRQCQRLRQDQHAQIVAAERAALDQGRGQEARPDAKMRERQAGPLNGPTGGMVVTALGLGHVALCRPPSHKVRWLAGE